MTVLPRRFNNASFISHSRFTRPIISVIMIDLHAKLIRRSTGGHKIRINISHIASMRTLFPVTSVILEALRQLSEQFVNRDLA